MKHECNRVSGTKKRTEDKDSPLTYSQMTEIVTKIRGKTGLY